MGVTVLVDVTMTVVATVWRTVDTVGTSMVVVAVMIIDGQTSVDVSASKSAVAKKQLLTLG